MGLGELLRFRHRKQSRENRTRAIEQLGFTLLDERGWHAGKFWPKRYILLTPAGERLDNDGNGYRSTNEAYQAAKSAAKKLPPPDGNSSPPTP